ncbi:alpha-1,4-glucan--maltose-1-phosphate maltosyltransferase [Granulicella cerasi]|uniref:Alpha-1,4-glucan:maltose-1-phosphate maltosyltransferase n=1 Tax=Granulicella cerasi TaxID=741063 RepID=A0ABW1Z7T4_9BACT|nr:alpha-1,4-glucan--maltose-1-phosphate maltosyltransferase [Granulicella cerasi]
MKPSEGRRRVVIEAVTPSVNAGRYAAKRVVGDVVKVQCAAFADGHDHVSARVLYKPAKDKKWRSEPLRSLPNDLWEGEFTVDKMGSWVFTVEAWIDHFDTWVHDLDKRLGAQVDSPQDIPLALRIGANHLEAAAKRAKGKDAAKLKLTAEQLIALAESNLPFYENPIKPDVLALAAQYPDLAYATTFEPQLPLWVDRERARFSAWYELFPRSCSPIEGRHGTLKDVVERLPEIARMGFDIVYMPPIHPIGVQYRKGKNNSVTAEEGDVGSPWAVGGKEGGHTAILPELGTLDDFADLVSAAQMNGLEVALDIAFQCAPDHPWVKEHPDWFIIRPDGTIQYAENPPKKYQDIYPLNFESKDWKGLWDALYGVFKFWVDRGVKVFRVDNPHTKALPFWEWCIAEVLAKNPDVIFLAEAFTRPHVMYSLAKGGYTQGYTYFTWRNTKADLEAYFTEICNEPVRDFFRPNVWPNTPDILHEQLQTGSPAMFKLRATLAATLSANWGIYGPAYELCEGRPAKPSPGKTSSEEYLDSEKYQLRSWDRSNPISIAPYIRKLNEIRRAHESLQRNENLVFHTSPNEQIIAYSKRSATGDVILTIVNLDHQHEQSAWLDLNMEALGLPWSGAFTVEDLLTGTQYDWNNQWNFVALKPETAVAHVFRIRG